MEIIEDSIRFLGVEINFSIERLLSISLIGQQLTLTHPRFWRLSILSISVGLVLTILCADLSFAMGPKNRTREKGLYFYSGKDILRFLKKIGYPDYPLREYQDISRNSHGTALRFVDGIRRRVVIVTCDGSIECKDVPGYPVWFDDEHEAVAWHKRDKGTVYYKQGATEKISANAFNLPDISGSYLVKSGPILPKRPLHLYYTSEIFSAETPNVPIAKVGVSGIIKIFLKDGKLVLFGNDYSDREKKLEEWVTAHVLEFKDGTLKETEQVAIEPPSSRSRFYAIDMSPWSDEVLFLDPFDFPSRSVWYVFNLKTRERKKVGKKPYSGGWGFYLQCNIIEEVAQKYENRPN